MAAAIDGAMCQRHMFSTDRNEVQINAADGKIDGMIVIEVSLSGSQSRSYPVPSMHMI